jgi:Fe-S cluster biogenesis protein NfuA
MVTREQVEDALERVRPFLRADGGDIEVVEVSSHTAGIRLTGACRNCPSVNMTLHIGIESVLRREVPEFETLHLVQ